MTISELIARLNTSPSPNFETERRTTEAGRAYGRSPICAPSRDVGAMASTPAHALVIAVLKAKQEQA